MLQKAGICTWNQHVCIELSPDGGSRKVSAALTGCSPCARPGYRCLANISLRHPHNSPLGGYLQLPDEETEAQSDGPCPRSARCLIVGLGFKPRQSRSVATQPLRHSASSWEAWDTDVITTLDNQAGGPQAGFFRAATDSWYHMRTRHP